MFSSAPEFYTINTPESMAYLTGDKSIELDDSKVETWTAAAETKGREIRLLMVAVSFWTLS